MPLICIPGILSESITLLLFKNTMCTVHAWLKEVLSWLQLDVMSLSPDFFLWGVKLPLDRVSGRLEEFLVGQGKVTLHPGEGLHVGGLKIQTVLQCTVPCVHCIPGNDSPNFPGFDLWTDFNRSRSEKFTLTISHRLRMAFLYIRTSSKSTVAVFTIWLHRKICKMTRLCSLNICIISNI